MKRESIDYSSVIKRDNLMKIVDKAVTEYKENLSERMKEIYRYSSKELDCSIEDLRDFSLDISLEGMEDYIGISDCIHYRKVAGLPLMTLIEDVESIKIDNRFIHYEIEFRYGYSQGIIFRKNDLDKVIDWIENVKKKKVKI